MKLSSISKEAFIQAFRSEFEGLTDKETETMIMKWVWETVIQENVQEAALQECKAEEWKSKAQALQRKLNQQDALLKGFMWNVHEIRKKGRTLYAFFDGGFAKGDTPGELLEAFDRAETSGGEG